MEVSLNHHMMMSGVSPLMRVRRMVSWMSASTTSIQLIFTPVSSSNFFIVTLSFQDSQVTLTHAMTVSVMLSIYIIAAGIDLIAVSCCRPRF